MRLKGMKHLIAKKRKTENETGIKASQTSI